MKADEDGSVRSVLRAFDLLALFTEHRRTWAVKDLTTASGLAKTTVLRLVATCEQRGLLWTRPDGRITVGPGMLRWAQLANTAWQLPEPVRQVLRELARECRETVNLYVRSTAVLVCVAQQEGPLAIRHVGRVGDELPLGFGAAGRVLDGAEGAAVSHGEPEPGASSVAAPVHDGDGRLLAALAITGPSSRFGPGEVAAFTEALAAASVRISQIGLATRAE
ncbi:IclR family transcriptional regulator [Amycolatopsis mediterranei S699]|jgi:DNA-binding IclR family transcriptional regulator|uniref:IclR family transcriptional regulator n=2 Tax=Amycolatopsis mediterranei TaxID=33910 RepID=A0A0H3DG69_AMYMU|nr:MULTISPECIES: IclR family transcriptional regulator [Amycolatopsis]ADJ48659.1 IclR family transcriptional regulator [Amycolatopsis mediterranei U32]AEK45594.1 IclR family transcriptional regulator [Amycolatopsis mediterranei S699]AFO80368.1 IclR family transcriptional regulator [Amycolatopsis mediterranei S699]AGT87496.1 IclR family transcriptional regulator [Amycolatopsis mediterranei RB]KDO03875.1 transcriptional regulator [Amycolatopsis mediterranei]